MKKIAHQNGGDDEWYDTQTLASNSGMLDNNTDRDHMGMGRLSLPFKDSEMLKGTGRRNS